MNLWIRNLLLLSVAASLYTPLSSLADDDRGRISLTYSRAEEMRLRGDFDAALLLYTESGDLSRSFGLAREEIRARMKLGLINWNIGKVKDAADQYAAALAAAVRSADRRASEDAKKSLDVIDHYKQGKKYRDELNLPDKSLESFEVAVRLADSLDSPDLKLKCLRQESVVYFYKNDLVPYLRLNNEALGLAEGTRNERDAGICLNNIGIYYLRIGEYSLALSNSERALDIARKFKNPQNIADALNNLCVALSELGEFDKSIKFLHQVLELDKASGDPEKPAMDYNNIGIAYRRKGLDTRKSSDFDAAAGYFEKALAIVQPGKNAKLKIKTLNNLGAVFAQTGRSREALARFQEALAIADKIRDDEESSIILNNIGIVYSDLGDWARSTEHYRKAIDLATRFQGKGILWEIYLDLANSQRKQNLWGAAEENYRASITIIEGLRSSIGTEDLKATYLGSDKRMDAYFNLADLYARQILAAGSAELEARLFEVFEKAKARAFLDSLEVSNIEVAGPIDAERANREQSIVQQITTLYRDRLMPGRTGEQDAAFRENIADLESRLDRVRREFRAAHPEYGALRLSHIVPLAEARAAFSQPGTVLLAFMVGSDTSWGLAIKPGMTRVFELPSRAALKPLLESFLVSISDKDRTDFSGGFELYRNLVEPAISPETKNLVLIPDDLLNYLPFEALPISADGRNRLVGRCSVSYAPSVSSLLAIQNREPGRTERQAMALLAVGAPDIGEGSARDAVIAGLGSLYPAQAAGLAPIPFARTEIEKISAFFPSRETTILTGADADEGIVKKRSLLAYRIIHFAAHGFIDDKNPSRSALVLSQNGKSPEDGLLLAQEIYRLRTRADLVVLSSCQTALGRMLRGEGIEGMNRAFFYSGSSSVLMTLWSIHDQAGAQFMERFYNHLAAGRSIAEALRKAKIDMIASPYYSHPYYWAGYVLNGDGARIVFPSSPPFGIFIGAAGLAGMLALGWIFIRRKRRPV
jgi:tetratricopeptide (TPR) repeat protein